MIKTSFQYDQTTARLYVEGLPDFSIGQEDGVIGILSGWRIELIGSHELEGKKEHLQSLMNVVQPYVRHRLSGVERSFGDPSSHVSIRPLEGSHEILLRSSQVGVNPLTIVLDDAELADLIRCLDDLILDHRVRIDWTIPANQPLLRRDLVDKVPFVKRFFTPVLGTSIFILTTSLFLTIPLPTLFEFSPSLVQPTDQKQ